MNMHILTKAVRIISVNLCELHASVVKFEI